ncbi:hypothetical protein FRC08_004695 [Ceratobasidium sp. 394]|nr:hypothetical protein FRC08_004695 [Ceratobasidium sp. 394]
MVIHEDIQEIRKSIGGLFRNVGKIKAFRRQCFTLIQVCMDLQRHWEGHRQGSYHDLKRIIQEASGVLTTAADPEGSKRMGEVSAGFEACIGSIERYDRSYLTSCRHSGGNTMRCPTGDHNYRAKLATATSADKRRETRAVKIFQKTPREVKGAKKKVVHFIFHSFAIGKERTLSYDVYEDTTLSELLYKFNKGIKGVRITLAENPRFYLDLSHPYNTPELLGIKQTMFDPPGAVPRKIPEQNLSNFFRDREGALYDGIHLKRLIPYNISNEDTLKNMMKTWLSLRPTAASAPLPLHGFWGLDFWQQVPPGEEFDRWFQIVLEHLIDNARHFGPGSTPVITMPKPELPQISEPIPHLTPVESSGSAVYPSGTLNTVAYSTLSLNTTGRPAQAMPAPQPNITKNSGATTAVSRVDAMWEMPGAYNFPEVSEHIPRSVESNAMPTAKKKSWIRRTINGLIGRA